MEPGGSGLHLLQLSHWICTRQPGSGEAASSTAHDSGAHVHDLTQIHGSSGTVLGMPEPAVQAGHPGVLGSRPLMHRHTPVMQPRCACASASLLPGNAWSPTRPFCLLALLSGGLAVELAASVFHDRGTGVCWRRSSAEMAAITCRTSHSRSTTCTARQAWPVPSRWWVADHRHRRHHLHISRHQAQTHPSLKQPQSPCACCHCQLPTCPSGWESWRLRHRGCLRGS